MFGLIIGNQSFQQSDGILNGHIALFGLFKFDTVGVILVTDNTADILRNASSDTVALTCQFACFSFQPLLQFTIALRLENMAEYLYSFISFGQQKLHKIALRYHGYLTELIAVDTDYLLNGTVDLLDAGYDPAVGIDYFGIGGLLGDTAAALGLALVLGVAFYRILFAVATENQLNLGRNRRVSIL